MDTRERHLANLRQADRAWRRIRARRLELILKANSAGVGYATIAQTLGTSKSYVQKVVNQANGRGAWGK